MEVGENCQQMNALFPDGRFTGRVGVVNAVEEERE